jgi:hypothetical protein
MVIVLCSMLVACCQPAPAPRAGLAEVVVSVVKAFAGGQLSADAARQMLQSERAAERQGGYWQIRSGLEEIVLKADASDEPTDDAELRLTRESRVRVADLESVFGAWDVGSESVTSTVIFRVPGHADRPTTVFVRLFSGHPERGSLVSSLQLRR